MKIFLLKDVQNVGLAGEMVKVSDGFAKNFLLPQKIGIQVTPSNEADFKKRLQVVEVRKEIIQTKTSSLAEKIKSLQIVLKRKLHDDGKLYGALNAQEIVDALAEKGVSVSKNQIVMDKAIKAKGMHTLIVKLSTTLQPTLSVKIVSED
ncbi:TPA: 50S ribosomal protein L9 [Candidatus Dependentiae bacterium]|nr:MAG: 50S ribosomal protein L9 [candidate division TM6 bacterium GW2011_GWF2_43_87]HBL98734.1 50S ribosomal protein L9 [Candidatus Dependentiae bacterium]